MTKKLDIEFPRDFYLDDVGVWRLKKEKITELEASNVQTNENWIKSLDTEQLADVFYMVFHNHADRVLNAFWDKHKDVFKKDMMEWLKQPHSEVADDKTM